MSEVKEKGLAAKRAGMELAGASGEERDEALRLIGSRLLEDEKEILEANALDLKEGGEKGLPEAVLDRILLNPERLRAMADAVEVLSSMPSPLGETLETIEKENGLKIVRRRVPIGVIGMIYEARPNVTVDAATLALKTGNAVILRGSSSAIHSNTALVKSIHRALGESAIPTEAVALIEDTSRETAKELFGLNEYLDVLIPRGGKKFIETVIREASVPVIETGAGNCHIFIDRTADPEMAEEIVLNAKCQRPSVCNAVETVLIEEDWFKQHGAALLGKLHENGVDIVGDEAVTAACPSAAKASEEDWEEEFLDLRIAVKTVEDVKEAIDHINKYGTKHSEAIITEDAANAELFQARVDASCVYHNASTRFTDGFEFGYGAEIGISTQKLHARGPMGLAAMTSSKYFISGDGQIRK